MIGRILFTTNRGLIDCLPSNQIQPLLIGVKNEWAPAVRDGETCVARPNSEARTRTCKKTSISLLSRPRAGSATIPVDAQSAIRDDHKDIHAPVVQLVTSTPSDVGTFRSNLGAVTRSGIFPHIMPNKWRTIISWVHKILLHGRRGKGTVESFSREKFRKATTAEVRWRNPV